MVLVYFPNHIFYNAFGWCVAHALKERLQLMFIDFSIGIHVHEIEYLTETSGDAPSGEAILDKEKERHKVRKFWSDGGGQLVLD